MSDGNDKKEMMEEGGPEEGLSVMTEMPDGKAPFQEFQTILGFLASIGLAVAASSAISLVGVTSSFGDTSAEALAYVREVANLLAWASACFIVALAFMIAPQLLYTDKTLYEVITRRKNVWNERIVWFGVGIFAWTSLAFQVAAFYLLSQSLGLVSKGAMQFARYGITAGVLIVGIVGGVGIFGRQEGRKRAIRVFHPPHPKKPKTSNAAGEH